ncbi:hypothetical protein pb186bvf_001935 [Paramecium bursaria]
METQLGIFQQEIEELVIKSQINMRKLTMNDVQLSDLLKTSVNDIQQQTQSQIKEINDQIKLCINMQEDFLQIEALQKKIQIFRILIEDAVQKKEKKLSKSK